MHWYQAALLVGVGRYCQITSVVRDVIMTRILKRYEDRGVPRVDLPASGAIGKIEMNAAFKRAMAKP